MVAPAVAPAGCGMAWLKLSAGPNLYPAAEQSPSPVLGGALGALLRQPELIKGLGELEHALCWLQV